MPATSFGASPTGFAVSVPHPVASLLTGIPHQIGSPVPATGGSSSHTSPQTNMEVIRITGTGTIAPTNPNSYLVGLYGISGAITGYATVLYDGVHSANFLFPSAGLNSAGTIGPTNSLFYPMNVGPTGTATPSFTFTNLTSLYGVFSNRQNPLGRQYADFRSVVVQTESSAASSVNTTFTIPGPVQSPLGVSAELSLAATATGVPEAALQFPTVNNWKAYQVPFTQSLSNLYPRVYPVPQLDPANSFVLVNDTYNLGGATDIWLTTALWY